MPELPEVETVVRELQYHLPGKKVQEVTICNSKLLSLKPELTALRRVQNQHTAKAFVKILTGARFTSCSRRGKLIILELKKSRNTYVLVIHLKMTGQFIYEAKDKPNSVGYRLLNKKTAPLIQLPSKHTHVMFRFYNQDILFFNDVRQFASIRLLTAHDLAQVSEFASYGPEPLSKEFTAAVLRQRLLKKKKSAIKAALMDNSVVVGIGNIYSDEILFHAQIQPTRLVQSLKPKEYQQIFKQVKPVLQRAIRSKGSSVGDFVRTDGTSGSMGKYHFVYGRGGKPCKQCDTILTRVVINGRSSVYCKQCQK